MKSRAMVFRLLLLGVLTSELVAYFFSLYDYNSVNGLFFSVTIIATTFFATWFFKRYEHLFIYFCSLISVIAIVSSVWNFSQFKGFIQVAKQYGFNDNLINEIRYLFRPYNLLINDWSSLLVIMLPFPIIAAIYHKDWRILYALVFGATLAAILISGSRGAFISTLAFSGVILLLSLLYIRPIHVVIKKAGFFILPAVLFCGILVAPYQTTVNRVNPIQEASSESMSRSTKGRLDLWLSSLNLVTDNLFTGVGQNNFALYANARTNENQTFTARVHNSFLELIFERGLIGFFAYGGLIFYVGWYLFLALQTREHSQKTLFKIIIVSSILAVLVRQLTHSSIFHQWMEFSLFMILIFMGSRHIYANGSRKTPSWFYFSIGVYLIFAVTQFNIKQRTKNHIEAAVKIKMEDKNDEAIQRLSKIPEKHRDFVLYQLLHSKLLMDKDSISKLLNDKNYNPAYFQVLDGLEAANRRSKFLDDLVAHNLGWFYLFYGNQAQAEKNFSHAAKLRPADGIYQLSLGHFYFKNGKTDQAIDYYQKAIIASPTILLSPFMKSLEANELSAFTKMKNGLLESIQSNNNQDPIFEAKKAAILLYLGATGPASQLLEMLSQRMPNLSRVWFNLALCRIEQNQPLEAKQNLKKAIFLNRFDYLPYYSLAKLEASNNRKAAIIYYKKALTLYQQLNTSHFERSRFLYASITLRDNMIPNAWLYQSKPYLDVPIILHQLSKLLFLEGKLNEAKYFKSLSQDIHSIKSGDIQKKVEADTIEVSNEVLHVFDSHYPEFINASPDHNLLLLKTRRMNDFELQLYNRKDQKSKPIDESPYTQLSLTWHPHGEKIYYQQYEDKIRGFELLRLDIKQDKKEKVPCPPSNSAIAPLKWSSSGRYLAYLSTGKNNTLYIYDDQQQEVTDSIAGFDLFSRFAWKGDSVIWYFKDPRVGAITAYHLNSKTTEEHLIQPKAELNDIDVSNEYTLVNLRLPSEEYYQLHQYNAIDKSITALSKGEKNVSQILHFDRLGSIYTYNANGLFKPKGLKNIDTPTILDPESSIEGVSKLNKDQGIFKIASTDKAIQARAINLQSGESNLVFTNDLNYQPIAPRQGLLAGTANQPPIPYFIWSPSDSLSKNARKAILYIHGGPHIQFRPILDPKIQALVKAGFYFIAINYSGSSGYSKTFEAIEDSGLQQADILRIMDQIVIENEVLPKNIILMASSYGGILAYQVAKQLEKLGGIIWISAPIPKEIKPLRSVSKHNIWAYYGSNDPIIEQSYSSLIGEGIIPQKSFHVFPQEGHFFHRTSSWALICQQMINRYQGPN